MKYQLGASLNAIESPLSGQTAEALGRSGIATFEPCPADFAAGRDVLDKFSRMLAETGKTAPTFHLPWGTRLDISSIDEDVRRGAVAGLREYFPAARAVGAGILVEHPSYEPIPVAERPRRIAQARKSLRELSPVLRDAGLRMAIELLPRTCLGNTGAELLELVGDLDDAIGVCLDTNHLTGAPLALPGAVRALGGRILCLHVSDYGGEDELHSMPGDGVIDWRAFVEALDETGYAGDFNYETTITLPPEEQIAEIERNFDRVFRPLFREDGPRRA